MKQKDQKHPTSYRYMIIHIINMIIIQLLLLLVLLSMVSVMLKYNMPQQLNS